MIALSYERFVKKLPLNESCNSPRIRTFAVSYRHYVIDGLKYRICNTAIELLLSNEIHLLNNLEQYTVPVLATARSARSEFTQIQSTNHSQQALFSLPWW